MTLNCSMSIKSSEKTQKNSLKSPTLPNAFVAMFFDAPIMHHLCTTYAPSWCIRI